MVTKWSPRRTIFSEVSRHIQPAPTEGRVSPVSLRDLPSPARHKRAPRLPCRLLIQQPCQYLLDPSEGQLATPPLLGHYPGRLYERHQATRLISVAMRLTGPRRSEAVPDRGQRGRAEGTFGASPRWGAAGQSLTGVRGALLRKASCAFASGGTALLPLRGMLAFLANGERQPTRGIPNSNEQRTGRFEVKRCYGQI